MNRKMILVLCETPQTSLPQAGDESAVVASVLATTGELARVAGAALRGKINDIFPLIIDAIQDAVNSHKRLVAVTTLGQLVENTGVVVVPYTAYPQLLGLLLRMMNEGQPKVRREVMKVRR